VRIYDWHAAPNPRRVHIFLAEKGLSVPLEEVADGMNLKEEYKQNFPQAMVPILELDDGTVIGEAMAICRYFEESYPDPPLFGTNPISKARVHMWETRANEEGFLAFGELFRNTHPDFVDRGPPGSAEPIPQIPALIDRAKGRIRRFYRKLDDQLAVNAFVAGDSYSVADITALCAVDFGAWTEMGVADDVASEYPNVKRWHAIVSARPSAST
jgi:glutathione S-transferase